MRGESFFARLASVGVVIFLLLALGGCASLLGSESDGGNGGAGDATKKLRAENNKLKSENEKLRAEIEALQKQASEANAETTSPEVQNAEPTQTEDEEDSGESSGDSNIQVAGDGDLSGESVPEIMPKDLPLPSGANLDYVNEDDYNFDLDFVLDSDLQSLLSFYEDELKAAGWKEVDRTEYERDGLKGIETSWEKGVFVPEDGPQGSDYEQTDQTLRLVLQEIQPSGSAGRIFWNSYKLLNETS